MNPIESTMTPLEIRAWTYLAESGELAHYLNEGAHAFEQPQRYQTRLAQEAIRIGSEIRRQNAQNARHAT